MYNPKISNGYIVRVIEKISPEGTFLKEKRVINKEEEAMRTYNNFLKTYPDLKVECYNYKSDTMVAKNY